MAVKDCYTDYQVQDYNQQYDPIPLKPTIDPRVIDHNRLELDPDDSYPIWMDAPPLKNIVSLTLRYQAHQTSNVDNARNTLRYGSCETLGQTHQVWGFETYQEARDHLSIHDKPQMAQCWEEIKYELRQQSNQYLFWIPKTHQHQTHPGCWAISIEHAAHRDVVIWADQQLRGFLKLKLSKQNRLILSQGT